MPENSNRRSTNASEQYLTVGQVAERLGTSERFPRRLIAERRIAFVKIGSHVRISESVLAAYIEANTVAPVRSVRRRFGRAA
ncbi:excisionase family DNA-binding protein [Kitasatospora sp. MAP5-34]|uniref:excisionase family DNA-binding protein n=1 Tax=Kitasatospora sp. MAP5-34 TaxID=3035102 RepID=UPI00247617C1|nr:excisionase family DNA-binding protein [Kitasatospora sp. MAP5-34]MDH6580329.1 excisionase family DNA binding protein [Kitasatospora sp. MAP5-34]